MNLILHPVETSALRKDGPNALSETDESMEECKESQEELDVEFTISEIEQLISCLQKLSMTIEIASVGEAGTTPLEQLNNESIEFYSKLIQARFPQASSVIVERLGKATATRAQFHQNSAQQIPKKENGSHDIEELSKGNPSSLPLSRTLDQGESLGTMPKPAPFIGGSCSSGHSYLPERATFGRPFTCLTCDTLVKIGNIEEWKVHMYKDMRAYVCTDSNCFTPARLFKHRDEWFEHELQKHRKVWRCKDHCGETFVSGTAFAQHLSGKLDIPITRIDEELIAELSSTAADESTAFQCTLCRRSIVGAANLKSHLGSHLESIALAPMTSDEDVAQDMIAKLWRSETRLVSTHSKIVLELLS